jgi:hypothetical protein
VLEIVSLCVSRPPPSLASSPPTPPPDVLKFNELGLTVKLVPETGEVTVRDTDVVWLRVPEVPVMVMGTAVVVAAAVLLAESVNT